MGSWNSGRHGGRPVVEDSLTLNLALCLRKRWIRDGVYSATTLTWTFSGGHSNSIGVEFDLCDPNAAYLTLRYTTTRHGERKDQVQRIRLSTTQPRFGGRRWWMHCPVNGKRVAKLHLPPGGDIFASRAVWRLGYRSQHSAPRDRPFDKLNRLQRKLGSPVGYNQWLIRPKGMWRRTYERHLERYQAIEHDCDIEWNAMAGRLIDRSDRLRRL